MTYCRIKGTKEHQIPVGFFGDSIAPEFDLQVFIDKKPLTYSFSEQTKEMTEGQIFEMYAPKEQLKFHVMKSPPPPL